MSSKQDETGKASFDLDKLRELMELMEAHDVREIKLQHGDERWQMRRGPQEVMPIFSAGPPAVVPNVVPQPTAAPSPDSESPPDDGTVVINSPTVGTFYEAASPEDPAFVSVGSKVEPDMIVCLVEAMKVFNQIPAEVSGTITEILVSNGEAVEFNQPLYRVRPG